MTDSTQKNISVPIAEAKLDHLLKRLYSNYGAGSYRTQEEISRAIFSITKILEKGADKPIYNLPSLLTGAPPDRTTLNTVLLGVFNEVDYLMDALYRTGSSIEQNFNFAASRIRKLQADIKYCYQQLGAYTLYVSEYGNRDFFAETFSNEDNIDRGSRFLTEKECFINLEEGTIALPLEGTSEKWPIQRISLGERSNCVLGNNVEAGVPIKGRINDVHDGNADTWTEFERVVSQEDDNQLVLELKISFDDRKIINNIVIVPLLLGARTPPTIESIEVSSDGRRWISINDEVRVATFMGEKEEERYHLSPHTGKFSGEFNISFPPRFAKLVRITIRQSSAFPIKDVYGITLLRYAVALKEIEVYGSKFESTGELISKQVSFDSEVRAVSLQSLVDPPNMSPDVGNAEYFLSFDDGVSWNQIVPQEESSLTIPEVLFPPEGQTSMRFKVKLIKNEIAFSSLRREQIEKRIVEVQPWGTIVPTTMNLRQKPISGTFTLCDPEVAVRGRTYPKMILGNGVYSRFAIDDNGDVQKRTGAAVLKKKLTLQTIVDPDSIKIEVDGQEWTRVTSFASSNWYNTHYILQRNADDGTWEIVFGNNDFDSPKGAIPGAGQQITFRLSDEKLNFDTISPPYISTFDYPTNGEKKDTTIFFNGETKTAPVEVIPPGVLKYRLKFYPIDDDDFTISRKDIATGEIQEINHWDGSDNAVSNDGSNYFNEYKTFIDGTTELVDNGDFTIDLKTGWIYFYRATHDEQETSISYEWSDDRYLQDEDWDFVEGRLDQIQVYESGYFTLDRTLSVAIDKLYAQLTRSDGTDARGVVPKSVRIDPADPTTGNGYVFGDGVPAFEVAYINGHDEFEERGHIQDETVPTVTGTKFGAKYIANFRLTQWQTMILGTAISFSDSTIFQQEKTLINGNTELTSVGDWAVDYNGSLSRGKGYIYVRLLDATTSTAGNVSYQYRDANSLGRIRGAYSVDYNKGKLYFSGATYVASTVSYKIAPYDARYTISQELKEGEEEDYTLDIENQQATIYARSRDGKGRFLTAAYKYQIEDEDVLSLAEYFTPLLRAISIKAALF
jgi:hypothetical protein